LVAVVADASTGWSLVLLYDDWRKMKSTRSATFVDSPRDAIVRALCASGNLVRMFDILRTSLFAPTTRERRCLTEQDLATVFPTLNHAAMARCTLRDEKRHGDTVSYRLECDGGQQTTGTAQWLLGSSVVIGRLACGSAART
jgi:hypothetical protein